MFQPFRRDCPDGVLGYEGGGDGHVIDLDTAVKDEVLGRVVGAGVD